jgi:putative hydrolase of the HAD superfamily
MIEMIAFDGDDTLWHNEPIYLQAKEDFIQIVTSAHDLEAIGPGLDEIELRNLQYYGYGLKSFVLSMIEASIHLTGGKIESQNIHKIIQIAKQMLDTPVQLFDQVEETLAQLSAVYPLMLITKGDTFEQERKVRRTGLAQYFRQVEIVADKSVDVYRSLLNKYHLDPRSFLMVGNSLRSDILPVLNAVGKAVYIPYIHTWSHETVELPAEVAEEFFELEHLGQLPALLDNLS